MWILVKIFIFYLTKIVVFLNKLLVLYPIFIVSYIKDVFFCLYSNIKYILLSILSFINKHIAKWNFIKLILLILVNIILLILLWNIIIINNENLINNNIIN